MAQAKQKDPICDKWLEEIAIYERKFRSWEDLSKKIVKRYKDERPTTNAGKAQFNILWSNIQTLQPALFSKNPVPNIDRRFEDDDEAGIMAARVLERCSTYFIDTDIFSNVTTQAVLDRLLGGRGTVWARYVPHFRDARVEGSEDVKEQGVSVTDDTVKGEPDEEETQEEVYAEDVVYDYVHWEDFGHTWGRTWEEVDGIWRIVYMTRKQMKERGFKNAATVPVLDQKDEGEQKTVQKKAKIYEIWDKSRKEVVWIHKDMLEPLDRRPDPLGLKDFFPCPKPIFATLGNDNLIPVPDYRQYETQAKELDAITARITSITKAVKVIGVHDASAEGLSRMLTEGMENTLIPVEKWAVFGEKGGLKGVVDFFPLEQVVSTLISLYEAREKVKQDLYEITGLSDIIRGATDPNETLGAQELKGKFATLRMDSQQKDVARFCRDMVRITAEIIAKHFSIDTIKQICGIRLLNEKEKQELTAKTSQPGPPGPDGQPTPPPPIPDEIQELLENPTWEEIEALLRDDVQRCFRISIETDSTIKTDQEAEKQSRIELLTAVGSYFQTAVTLPPQLQPLAAHLLQFGVKGFKVSRDIDTMFDVALKKLTKEAENPQPKPDPETEKMQMQAQQEKEKMAFEREKMGQDKYLADQKTAVEAEKLKNERLKIRVEGKAKVDPEVAMSDPDFNDGQVTPLVQMINENMGQIAQMIAEGFQQFAMQQAEANRAVLSAVTAPKRTKVIRGPDGRIVEGISTIGTETLQ